MKRIFIAAILTLAALSTAYAQEEDFDINKTINETNFLVNRGCSGTLISKQYRLVLTNYHCIDDKISTRDKEITGDDGTIKKVKVEVLRDVEIGQRDYVGHDRVGELRYMTKIVAKKKTSDLALLQLIGNNLRSTIHSPVLPNGRSVTRGDRVFVVGNPYGFDATVSAGIVSNTTRKLEPRWADGGKISFFQVDATVAPGNSGGALYNEDGHLIGVPAAAIPGVLGLAINTETIRDFLKESCYHVAYDINAEAPKICKLNRALEKCAQAKNKEACIAKTRRDAAERQP
jgi:S1-C subfamily serine protease